jgi:hypothetical protein
MKKVKLKLGSIKEMLTNEEMKKISGGYLMCCCHGGMSGANWSRSPDSTGNCGHTCTDPNSQWPGWGGEAWDANSACNNPRF